MGPIWDFDWAFVYAIKPRKHFTHPNESLFVPGNSNGTKFFSRIADNPAIQAIYNTEWLRFKIEKYPVLVAYIKEYAETIRESHANDQQVWKQSSGSIDKYSIRLLYWLDKRVAYMDGLATGN
jgi:hypothetical protein